MSKLYLGVFILEWRAGMAGETAYIGWKLYSKAEKYLFPLLQVLSDRKSSSILRSNSSSLLHFCAQSCHSIDQISRPKGRSSTGSDEKVEFVKSIGADIVFNYKTQSTDAVLEGLGAGIDIYWDNIGGETLEIAINLLNAHGCFPKPIIPLLQRKEDYQ
ncbi:hypothetical protein M422DRAFT_264058 [Sphaerobolus stellatus SS14]|uniref:Alcohol dehydrogenase-like C-terminal domain-containing protein n=1 Tax=Sphaerobolus stellatus (strain SS14) TaxID=990650 RepID=A0A0C9V908_SPHS4|nr:hypothetical protein M422DRAFT_264058 [Sphaerobolus stellatus SS14]